MRRPPRERVCGHNCAPEFRERARGRSWGEPAHTPLAASWSSASEMLPSSSSFCFVAVLVAGRVYAFFCGAAEKPCMGETDNTQDAELFFFLPGFRWV